MLSLRPGKLTRKQEEAGKYETGTFFLKKNHKKCLHEGGRSQTRENMIGILLLLSMIVATGACNYGDSPNGLSSYGRETVLYSTCLSTSCSWSVSGLAGSPPLRIGLWLNDPGCV